MPIVVDTSGRIYDDFLCLLFLHDQREESTLTNEIPEETGQFRFLRADCFTNIKGSVGLILAKASVMRISIPLDLSPRLFIPPPFFIHSRRPTTLLAPSLVFILCVLSKRHMKGSSFKSFYQLLLLFIVFRVTLFTLGFRLF
jgi:hypothetical protein